MIENYNPRDEWKHKTWALNSSDLFERFGFQDGALFEDLAMAQQLVMPDKKVLLKMVVEQFLLPKIDVRIELYDANTSHNRVRALDEYNGTFEHIEITVSAGEIFTMLDNTDW